KNGLRSARVLRGGDERIAQSLRGGDAETVFRVVPPQRVEEPLIAEFLAQGDEEQSALSLNNRRVLQRIAELLDGLFGLHVYAAQHPVGLISPAQLLVDDQIAQLLSVNGLVVVRGGEIGQGFIQVRGALGIAADRLAPPLFRDAVRYRKLERRPNDVRLLAQNARQTRGFGRAEIDEISLRDDHHSRKLDVAVPGGQRHLYHLKTRIRIGAEGLLIHVDRVDRKIERAFAQAFVTLSEVRDRARRARFPLRALHPLDDCDG